MSRAGCSFAKPRYNTLKATGLWCFVAFILICAPAASGAQSAKDNNCSFDALQGFMPDFEGSVYRVDPGLIVVETGDTRFFRIDVSCLNGRDAVAAAAVHIGDRVKLAALVVNPEKLVANSLEELPAGHPPASPKHRVPSGTLGDIDAIRQKAFELIKQLPDFLCEEHVKRLVRSKGDREYRLLDTLSMEVLYSRAKGENYEGLSVNGVPTSAEYVRLYGNISTGEFGSMIKSLFGSLPDGAFHLEGAPTAAGKPRREYSYSVSRADSDWRIESGYQFILPAYSGSIVVDDLSDLVRVDRTAEAIPPGFPYSFVESSIEYSEVEIQEAGTYRVPVKAQIDSCDRVTAACMRNLITFDSFRRFTGSSKLIFSK